MKAYAYLGTTLALILAAIPSHSAQHLLSFKTGSGQEARLLGDIVEDDFVAIKNPVLVVKSKPYKVASSSTTSALNELICRKIGQKARYTYAKLVKRTPQDQTLEFDHSLTANKSRAKTVVQTFHCIEGAE